MGDGTPHSSLWLNAEGILSQFFGIEERINRILWQEQTHSRLNDKARRLLYFLLDIFTQGESLVVYTPIVLVAFFMFCGASWQLFLPETDVARYQCYAMNFWFGTDALRHL